MESIMDKIKLSVTVEIQILNYKEMNSSRNAKKKKKTHLNLKKSQNPAHCQSRNRSCSSSVNLSPSNCKSMISPARESHTLLRKCLNSTSGLYLLLQLFRVPFFKAVICFSWALRIVLSRLLRQHSGQWGITGNPLNDMEIPNPSSCLRDPVSTMGWD